jgi:hypothetical protein
MKKLKLWPGSWVFKANKNWVTTNVRDVTFANENTPYFAPPRNPAGSVLAARDPGSDCMARVVAALDPVPYRRCTPAWTDGVRQRPFPPACAPPGLPQLRLRSQKSGKWREAAAIETSLRRHSEPAT